MDYFLRKADYYSLIQSDKLNVVIDSDESVRTDEELATEEEIKGYIRNRYDVNLVFAPLQSFSTSTTYYWGDRIYLTATAFSSTTVYTTGQYVLQAGNVYKSIAGSAAHAFNASEWTLLGAEGHYQMQVDNWDDEANYTAGDLVKYETLSVRKYYEAVTSNSEINPYEDDGTNWTEVLSQSGALPTTADYWAFGDSRNKLIKRYYIDICLYHLHSRINPRNIPEYRVQRRDEAIEYIKMMSSGKVTGDLELIAPEQGNNIAYGSKPVNDNFY
jgi:hypothetical protein